MPENPGSRSDLAVTKTNPGSHPGNGRPPGKPPCRICPWIWAALILLAVGAVAWYENKPAAPQAPGGMFGMRGMSSMAVPVQVADVQPARIDYTIRAIGTVTAFNTVAVRSRVDGELQQIAFEDGQYVNEGDLLAQIDPRPFQVQLDQALGQQSQNAAQLLNAQRDLQRYRQLYKQNSIARQVVDTQEAQVQQLLGGQRSDEAAVSNARLQLEYTRITAPISGRLGLRRLDKGNLISAANADGLVTITQIQPISVLFTVPQAQVPDVMAQLRQGHALTVDLYDQEGSRKLASGELMSLDNQIDAGTGTLKLKARFGNEDESLFPNQFVNVRLRVSVEDAPVTVPVGAVQHGSIGAFVYVVTPESTVTVRRVVTGRSNGERIAISSGLEAGERVVLEGTDRLREGSTIIVPGQDAQEAQANGVPPAQGARPRDGARQGSGGARPPRAG
ncbi:MdtA/MuxA family multidrug efflux RND transporter periplasmic adaptor subunit [Paracandidimonas soli]|uniref:MdtA/MuxA family multidrug efflux RND transporter periplasmic adaptor subunit n=1 Tax=Paracandidimonas soli TaxID=1917182 RepID=UPI003342B663